jgi:hypothetical protein
MHEADSLDDRCQTLTDSGRGKGGSGRGGSPATACEPAGGRYAVEGRRRQRSEKRATVPSGWAWTASWLAVGGAPQESG